MRRLTLRKLSVLAVVLLALVTWWALPVSSETARDFDDNAVVRGGVMNYDELHNACVANVDHTRDIFGAFGITNCDSALQGLVAGRVTRDNKVYVGDELVATNAMTAGRQRLSAGDTPIAGGAAYRRAPSVSFRSESLPAFVMMQNGVFKYAIIMSCGNPVTAVDVTPPPPPAPKTPNFEVVKDVRLHGQQEWQQNVVAQPGQRLNYRITVRNTGETELTNVIIRDAIPAEVTYESGSIQVNAQPRTGNLVAGFNVGNIAVGQALTLTFRATARTDLEACSNPAVNTGFAKPDNLPEESDTATVQICKPSTPPPPPPATPVVAQPALPKTGPGNVVAIFLITSLLGTAFYRLRSFYLQALSR